MSWNTRTVTELETELIAVEAEVSDARARQTVLVNELDRAQAPQSDGSRSMVEWVQAHLDIDHHTARDLVHAARRIAWHRHLSDRLITGTATFPRVIASLKYAETGATHDEVRRPPFKGDKRRVLRGARGIWRSQPALDESSYRMWGQLPGIMGRTVEKALHQRGDELPTLSDQTSTRGQRNADALTAIAMDSLEGLLCSGSIQVVGLDNATPVVTSRATRAIPRAIRHAVMYRDGGYTIDSESPPARRRLTLTTSHQGTDPP